MWSNLKVWRKVRASNFWNKLHVLFQDRKKWQLLVDDLWKIKGSKWILAPLPPATRWRVTRPRCKKNCVQAAKFKNKLEPKASLKTLIPTSDTAVNVFSHFENAKEFRRGWDSGHFACYYFYFQLLIMKLQDFCYNVTNLMELMKTDMNVPKAFICILFCR